MSIDSPAGSHESYEDHLREARASKWTRNIMGAGILAGTVALNFSEGISKTEHVEISSVGIFFAAIAVGGLNKIRREAIHHSHIDASLATIEAQIYEVPTPEWAEGNTGHILDTNY